MDKSGSLQKNLYVQLIKRLLVIYLLFTLCRLVFYWFNYDFYKERTFSQLLTIFAGGLRFDTTAILYTNILFILMYILPFKFRYNRYYQATAKYIYFITNGIAIMANCIDIVYFRFTMRRTTFDVFREFSHGENLGSIFGKALLEHWYLALFFIGLLVLMVVCYGKPLQKTSVIIRNPYLYYPVNLVAMVLSVGVIIIGFRGGVRHSLRPITLSNAGQYVQEVIDVPLVLNTPFSIYKTLERKGIQKLIYFDNPDELNSIYTPVHIPADTNVFKPENVMVIILESFGTEHWGFYNKDLEGGTYKGYTPFLDSLASESLTFRYSYGNGRKSIDAIASTLAGIPAIPEPFVLSPHFDNKVRALPQLLKEKGYQTAFFCGQPRGSMGFAAFCRLIGVEHIYEMSEYGNNADYDGIWGIWDEEFLQYAATEMTGFRQPFLSTFFTVSSHHPFAIPKRYENTFEQGTLPIHRCIRYTDYALKRFFETASQQPWYDNTLFVLVADHVNGIVHEEYNTTPEMFAVPVIFYKPGGSLKRYEDDITQQIDIMPTVLGYLEYDEPYFAFGFDVNKTADRFAVNYTNGYYQLYTNQYVLVFDGRETTGLYEIHTDMSNNLAGKIPDVQNELEIKLKAFLQQYTTGMVENRLTVNP